MSGQGQARSNKLKFPSTKFSSQSMPDLSSFGSGFRKSFILMFDNEKRQNCISKMSRTLSRSYYETLAIMANSFFHCKMSGDTKSIGIEATGIGLLVCVLGLLVYY